ncbi:hypothetical protein MVEG_01936 [Podila verticillata NRRL 6337]|nr:hypothetical protein MVEG_01936 [Podila verticillata NRRL 6337]
MATWNMSFDNSKQYPLNIKCLHDSLPTMVVMRNRYPYLYPNVLCRSRFANVADDDETAQIEDTMCSAALHLDRSCVSMKW